MSLRTVRYHCDRYSDFFLYYDSGSMSYQPFTQYVKTPIFLEYIADRLEQYSSDIKIDEEALNEYKISKVKANYNF